MKKILVSALGLSLFAAVAGCSKEPECTQELITKKSQELSEAVQAAVAKDPTKAAALATKLQEVATKYQGKTDAEACKAFDEVIAAVKG